MDGPAFFGALATSGLVLYALVWAAYGLRRAPVPLAGRRMGTVAMLSLAAAVLLAIDARVAAVGPTSGDVKGATHAPDSFWGLVYALLVERGAISLLALITLAAVVATVYRVGRALLTVEYAGAGIQIRLPGQTVHYVPLYPQISWQNTRITLTAGERVSVEISGYVSPGALGNLGSRTDRLQQYLAWATRYRVPATGSEEGLSEAARAEYRLIQTADNWDYTGPEGYPESWYSPEGQRPFMREHPLYSQPYYYKRDRELTVRGLPHNVVIGTIVAPGESRPRESRLDQDQEGYDYGTPDAAAGLINLSSDRYPIQIAPSRSGELWVVINDVDIARWDNTGMFFLKLTRNAWL